MAHANLLPIYRQQSTGLDNAPVPSAEEGPITNALQALWQEVAHRPLWAPPHFFRYLRLRSQLRLRFVDPTRLQLQVAPGKVSQCHSCRDSCCTGANGTVSLRLLDIARLLDMGRADLISHNKPIATLAQQGRSSVRQTLNSPLWRRFPVLAKDSMGACQALGKDGRCQLYPRWPLSCARFPYSLAWPEGRIFYSNRCQSFAVHPRYMERGQAMVAAAAACYNERLKDGILLAYRPEALQDLGLMIFVKP